MMRYFTAVVHKDEGTAYGLSFPDLPGCFAAAGTCDGIPAPAAMALDLWFEDQADVTPTNLNAIRAREDVTVELAEGAVLMPVAYIAPTRL